MQHGWHLIEVMFLTEVCCHLHDRYTISRGKIGTKLL